MLLSWVLLNDEVSFHQSKAIAVWIREPAADNRGGASVLEMPQLVRQKCLVGIY